MNTNNHANGKDTLFNVDFTKTTRHSIRVKGEADEDAIANMHDLIESAYDIDEAVCAIEGEGFEVIEFDSDGAEIESLTEIAMTAKVNASKSKIITETRITLFSGSDEPPTL